MGRKKPNKQKRRDRKRAADMWLSTIDPLKTTHAEGNEFEDVLQIAAQDALKCNGVVIATPIRQGDYMVFSTRAFNSFDDLYSDVLQIAGYPEPSILFISDMMQMEAELSGNPLPIEDMGSMMDLSNGRRVYTTYFNHTEEQN